MLLFWSGKGWMVLALAFGALFASMVVSDRFYHDSEFHPVPTAVALAVAGGLVWMIGRDANARRPKAGGSRDGNPGYHSLIFLRMEYWAVVFLVCAVAALLFR
jgi:hypothetical protein